MTASTETPGNSQRGMTLVELLVAMSIGLFLIGGALYMYSQSKNAYRAGDSLAKLGVAPSLVEARSGRSVYNLAVCAGQAPSSYFLLRRVLDSGARPTAILVDFFPRLLQVPPQHTPLWPALSTK